MTTTIRTGSGGASSSAGPKPELLGKVEGFKDKINGAYLLRKEDGVLTVCDDKSVRVWLRRETGMYWPSIHHLMPSVPNALHFSEDTGRLFVGQESGTVTELVIADDFNSLRHAKDFYSHTAGVTALRWCVTSEWVLSVGKDKALVWECSETGRRLGTFAVGGWCTALEFDAGAKYAFVGDYSGTVHLLKLGDAGAELVTKLVGHSGSIRSLCWDVDKSHLYSASNDGVLICWDIGGKQGRKLELCGHTSRVTAVEYSSSPRRVAFSAGDAGSLVVWDMGAQRKETPEWAQSDNCQRCDTPFFWNFKAMWDRRVVGLRQHHCRVCGAAVCYNCSQGRVAHPPMGYELPVRVCEECRNKVEGGTEAAGSSNGSSSSGSLAAVHPLGHSALGLDLDRLGGRLLSWGTDRLLKIWDVTELLK